LPFAPSVRRWSDFYSKPFARTPFDAIFDLEPDDPVAFKANLVIENKINAATKRISPGSLLYGALAKKIRCG